MINKCDYSKKNGKLVCFLHESIIFSIKILAALTVLVIILGVINSFWIIYTNLINGQFILDVSEFFQIFSQLLIVLIAIEIFQNIAMYIRTDNIPIKLVLATALIAVARKFIIIESAKDNFNYIISLSIAIVALSFSYWLIDRYKNNN
jgi:uncharacterized membrane protein (DUF373 family)